MGQRESVSGQPTGSPGQSTQSALAAGDIYRLVYFSTSLVRPFGLGGEKDIGDILHVSQRHNRARGITGALTFNEHHFAQALEGGRGEVGEVFASIRRDNRHATILVIEEGWIVERDFAAWAMAYVGGEGAPNVISTNLKLRDILARETNRGMALIEMMKFFLLSAG